MSTREIINRQTFTERDASEKRRKNIKAMNDRAKECHKNECSFDCSADVDIRD